MGRKYSDDQLIEAVGRWRNMRALLMELGLVPSGGNYETVLRRISVLGLDASHLRIRGRFLRTRSDAEVTEAVRSSRSLAQALQKLGLRAGGSNPVLKARIASLGIDTSHFVGQG